MISNKRSGKKIIKCGNGNALASQRTRPQGKSSSQPGIKSVRLMITRGKLGIFKLVSELEKPSQGLSKARGTSSERRPIGSKTVMHRIAVGVTSAALLFCTLGIARGQAKDKDKDPSHPAFKVLNGSHANPRITLTELLDSYEKAVGGKEAVEKIWTVIAHEERRAEIRSAGEQLFGSSVEYFKFPNKAKSVLTLPSGLRDVSGYDGKIAWYNSPSEGIQQLAPKQNALAAQELNVFNLLHLRAAFPLMTLVGSSKVEGRDVYVVDASLESLNLYRRLFFDAETRLLIGSVVAQVGAGPTQITEQVYSDFRVVHGVKFPFAVRAFGYNHQSAFELRRTRIECNTPLRDEFFSGMATADTPDRIAGINP